MKITADYHVHSDFSGDSDTPMEETIEKALAKLFETTINMEISDEPVDSENEYEQESVPQITDETIQKIIDSYEKLERAATTYNWVDFGTSMEDMKNAIGELKEKNISENPENSEIELDKE